MSIVAPPKLLTAEEFFDFANRPENRDRRFELEEGEVIEISRAGIRHGMACANLTGLFFMYCRQRKTGRLCSNDAGIIVERDPDTVQGPDVFLFLDDTTFRDSAIEYSETSPFLVIEVLSPNDRQSSVTRRLNRFIENGTTIVWLVDPDENSVTIWWQGQAPLVFEEGEEIANLPALPDFRCKVSEIFASAGS